MNNKKTLKRLLKLLLTAKYKLFTALFLSVISVLSTLFIPIYIGKIIDNIYILSINELLVYIIPLIIIVCADSLALFISTYLMNLISYNITTKLRTDIINKLLNVSIEEIYKRSEGDLLITYTADVNMIGDTSLESLTNLINGVITIISTLIIMLILNYKIAILVFVLTPLSLSFASLISKKIYKTTQKQTKIKARMSSIINEAYDIHDSVILDNYEDITINKFNTLNDELNKVGFKAQFLGALINPLTRFINSIIYASIVLYGLYNVVYFNLSVGSLQVFLNYTQSYTKPFNDCSLVLGQLANTLASANRVFSLLDLDDNKDNNELELTEINKIEFKDVSFKYSNSDKFVLKDINFTINKGDKVAIIGKTGSGKTTLINLLLGFYKVTDGEILINDININQYNIDKLRNKISVVLQESYIFNDTVYNNINYNNNLSLDDVVKYSKETNYHTFVRKYEKKYNTLISNNSISFGEAQALALTRTLAENNDFVIMDEATSNLDIRTEKIINKSLDKLTKDKTTLTIAHRISTINNASYIVLFNKGEILSIGSHNELIRNCPLYKEIYTKELSKDN